MSAPPATRPVTLVSACMNGRGMPEFAITTVEVTEEEEAEGRHYDLADVKLMARSYEEPFVHFAPPECPAFLLPAVRQHLGLTAVEAEDPLPLIVEKS